MATRRRVVGAVAFGAIAIAAIALWPRERVRVRDIHTTTAHVVPVPVAIAVEQVVKIPAERAGCPRPRTDAPRAQPSQPPERVDAVRVSATNAGWVAAWSETHIYVSHDAGASWQRVLDDAGAIRDVDFDCHGRVIAVRGARAGIHDGGETWHPLPLELDEAWHRAEVIGGGPDVAIVGNRDGSRLVISRDHGATWEQRELNDRWEAMRVVGRQYEDGRILAMVPLPDCMSEYPWVFEYRDGVVTHIESGGSEHMAFVGDVVVSNTGWHRIGTDEVHALPLEGWATVLEGPHPLIHHDGTLYRFTNGSLRELAWKLPEGAYDLVADRAGRLWYVDTCGQLAIATVRATPARAPRDGSSAAGAAAGCDPS